MSESTRLLPVAAHPAVEGLFDHRLGKASSRRVPVDEVAWVVDQYRTRHVGWTVKHFHDHLRDRHGFTLSYTWTKTTCSGRGWWPGRRVAGRIGAGGRASRVSA